MDTGKEIVAKSSGKTKVTLVDAYTQDEAGKKTPVAPPETKAKRPLLSFALSDEEAAQRGIGKRS